MDLGLTLTAGWGNNYINGWKTWVSHQRSEHLGFNILCHVHGLSLNSFTMGFGNFKLSWGVVDRLQYQPVQHMIRLIFQCIFSIETSGGQTHILPPVHLRDRRPHIARLGGTNSVTWTCQIRWAIEHIPLLIGLCLHRYIYIRASTNWFSVDYIWMVMMTIDDP